ncbi:MAG: ABC transporter permease [Acidimicrobiales bacterium]
MTHLAGTGALVRLVLRRDRLRLPIWLVGIVVVVVVSAISVVELYSTPEQIATYTRVMDGNPAVVVFSGPGHGFDDPNTGVVFANEGLMFSAVVAGLMSIFLVNRHTRAEEEAERTELLRSNPVGRHAALTATLVVVGAAQVALGATLAVAVGAAGLPALGSMAFGAAVAGAGLVFAAIAAVAAQITSSSRAALGSACAALGLAFALRAIGDIGDGTLSWLSPIGWAQSVRPWADERWWVLALLLLTAAALVATAYVLESRRDLGGGFVPQRLGPATAGPRLGSSLGLAVRLQRGMLIGWLVALMALGVTYGTVAIEIETMLEDSPELADFLASIEGVSITDAYLATIMTMLALMGLGFSLASVLRLRSEETNGRIDAILAAPVSRTTWAASHLGLAVVGTLLLAVGFGLATGVGYAVAVGESDQITRLGLAGLVQVLPMAVMIGGATVLVGWAPRAALAAWGGLAGAVVIGFFGELLRLPHWIRMVSPFEHTPDAPAASVAWEPLVVLGVVAIVLVGVGLVGLRRRDLG